MKMKRKIMAIWVILLLIAIPISIAEANENTKETNNETLQAELAAVNPDGTLTTETMYLSEEEVTELENTIPVLIDKIQTAGSWENLLEIIRNFLKNSPILNSILGLFTRFRKALYRSIVISSGHGFKFNPFKKTDFSLREKITFWHYSSDKLFKDRTIIITPLAFKMKILKGRQFGFMRNFFGIYLFIARKLPEKSYTFFIGTAQKARGIEVFPNI